MIDISQPNVYKRHMNQIPVAILVRVSTNKQETTRQVSELSAYAESKNYQIVEIVEECVSGRASVDDRVGLKRIEQLASTKQITKVLVHEISRVARRNSTLHRFVENLESWGVSLYWHSQAVETLLSNGKRNPAASLMLSMLSELARNEVEVLRDRIKSGLDEARRKGVKLGRKVGTGMDRDSFLKKHTDVVKLLKQGHSIRHAGKISAKGYSTIQRVKAAMEQELSIAA